jgi:hypothetical protein
MGEEIQILRKAEKDEARLGSDRGRLDNPAL